MTASATSPQDVRPLATAAPEKGAGANSGRTAADRAVAHNAVVIELLGRRIELPPPDQLAFLAGLGLLAALEILEWPVVLALAVGHELAHSHHGRALREFGAALEEA